ncbi:PorV/PorQ family protein [Melioribacteraceae bacterium 4301-Me]|uniref:PorV/PorQ family protein n=1 Tax=Pyranulibacter aquaticus TaxID=3163344 RepID=UPI00359BFE78
MKSKMVILFIVISFTCVSIYPQEFVSNVSKRGTTAAPFLSISQGARATGMGSAFVAIADDPTAIFWNPAGLTKVQGGAVVFDHTEWIADIKYNFAAASYNLGSIGTVGVSFISSDVGEMKVRTVDEPEGTGEVFSVSDVSISVAYAINLTDNFSIGFNPKFIQQSIWKTSATAFAIDMGVQYITPFDGIVLAMSISNFGTKMKLSGTTDLVLYDPDPTTTGNNGMIPAEYQTDYWELPLNFRVGLAYQPLKSDLNKLTLAVDAAHPSDNYESVNVGVEYAFNNMFFVRGGYKSLFLRDSEESFTFGFGVKQKLFSSFIISIDYSYGDFGRLNNVQKFSIGLGF